MHKEMEGTDNLITASQAEELSQSPEFREDKSSSLEKVWQNEPRAAKEAAQQWWTRWELVL